MIISHKQKFIFIKTHKTAGSSIELMLANICGPNDIITTLSRPEEVLRKELGFASAQNFHIPFSKYSFLDWCKFLIKRKKRRFKNHFSHKEIKKYVPKHIWNSYYTFCFERNPYEKVISWYHWSKKQRPPFDLNSFIEQRQGQFRRELARYYDNGEFMVNKVYKFEELDEALKDLTEKCCLSIPLKLPEYKVKGNVRSDRRPYTEVLNQRQKDLIYTIFRPVFNYLNYNR